MSTYEKAAVIISIVSLSISVSWALFSYFVLPIFKRLKADMQVSPNYPTISVNNGFLEMRVNLLYISRNPEPYYILKFVLHNKTKNPKNTFKTLGYIYKPTFQSSSLHANEIEDILVSPRQSQHILMMFCS